MNRSYLSVVLSLACLLGLGMEAHAQNPEVVATVPFDFVAAGHILPAGKYAIARLASDPHSGFTIRSYDNVAIVLPIVVDSTYAGQPKLNFEQVGGEYFLRRVETLNGVYSFAIPRPMAMLAQKKEGHSTMPSASGN